MFEPLLCERRLGFDRGSVVNAQTDRSDRSEGECHGLK